MTKEEIALNHQEHTDIWAFCGACRRWFYCPTWFDRRQPPPQCPVCTSEPTAIENRAGATGVAASSG